MCSMVNVIFLCFSKANCNRKWWENFTGRGTLNKPIFSRELSLLFPLILLLMSLDIEGYILFQESPAPDMYKDYESSVSREVQAQCLVILQNEFRKVGLLWCASNLQYCLNEMHRGNLQYSYMNTHIPYSTICEFSMVLGEFRQFTEFQEFTKFSRWDNTLVNSVNSWLFTGWVSNGTWLQYHPHKLVMII